MGIRGMRMEIRTREKITDKTAVKIASEEYKKIKPESGMTVKEAKDFIDGLFKAEA